MPPVALPTLSSAQGILSLLAEPHAELKKHALESLASVADTYWSEIADNIADMYVSLCSFLFNSTGSFS
jgi:hypothetical protein